MKEDTQYWKDRSERRILNAEKTAYEMLKDLKKLYQDTIERINKEVEAFYGRYATDTGLSIEEVKKLLTPEELKLFRKEALKFYEDLSKYPYDPTYRERLKNTIYTTTTKEGRKLYSLRRNVSRLDYIRMQMQNAVETLYARQNEAFTNNMSKVYEDTYMRSVFDTQQATGVFQSFNSLNNAIVQKTVQQKWLGENYSDRIWNDKNKLINTLETTFSQDVALGKNPRAIATDIKRVTGVRYSSCERLARTEFNNIANSASLDSYKSTDGLDKYKFVATLDSRTSPICAENDGKIYLVSEAEVGINYPPLHCYDIKTKIMTNNGMKYFIDLRDGDKILTLNPETLETEYQKPIAFYRYRYKSYMLLFEDDRTNLKVTPEHRMLENGTLKIALLCEKIYRDTGKLEFIDDCCRKYNFNGLIKRVPYDNDVFCVEVEKYHTMLVERKGKCTWSGNSNCRSTTIPYLEDIDYSKMERIAKDGTGKSYSVPATMSYNEWKSSLKESDGKYVSGGSKKTKK